MLVEDAALLESVEGSQIAGSKYKEVSPENDRDHQPFKKTKEKQPAKYCRDNRAKIEDANLYKRCVHTGQDCLVHNSR